jgi:hypothetical protein
MTSRDDACATLKSCLGGAGLVLGWDVCQSHHHETRELDYMHDYMREVQVQ